MVKFSDCRSCHGELESIQNFGSYPIISFGDKEQILAPLHLMKCKSCHLVQLNDSVEPDKLFRSYYYKSGINHTMREHLSEVVESALKRQKMNEHDVVIDIGSNDGTLLSKVSNKLIKIGFEPSQLGKDQPNIINEYFTAERFFQDYRRARLIFCIAMFYDLDDPNKFLDDIKAVLAPDGLLIIEMNYLPAMLENNRVDNIVAEHLCYYSLTSLAPLLARHGLDIDDVEFDEINGGVFRVYIRPAPEDRDVSYEINYPLEKDLDKLKTYQYFINRVQNNAEQLSNFARQQTYIKNTTIDVYAASTRGLMLMQLADLHPPVVRYAVDRNPAKVGKLYNGIRIISEEEMRKKPPTYLLLLAQHFLGETISREFETLKKGTKLILPFDKPRVLSIGDL